MKKILKLGVILFIVCAIVAGVLGLINELTYQRIADYNAEKTRKAYASVLPIGEGEEYVSLGIAETVNKVQITDILKASDDSGYVVMTSFSGAQGTITMAVGVSNEYTCTGISIISHSETSGLGANAASTAEVGVNFRDSFIGLGDSITVNDIDALTGATITSRSCANATAAAITAVEDLG